MLLLLEKILLLCLVQSFAVRGHLLIKEDPTLFSGHFEGDLIGINDKNKEFVHVKKWPDGVVHYEVDVNLRFKTRRALRKAMLEMQRKTCIRFQPKSENTKDYITFIDRRGCTAHLGNVGGAQAMSVGVGCDEVGIMLHELMHALGFWHENSRVDRDDFILINWDNLPLQYQKYFSAYTQPKSSHMGEKYDISSVTHMSTHAFAKDKKNPVLMPKDERDKISERLSLSPGDAKKIKRMYCGMAIPRFDPPRVENLAREEVEEVGISEPTDVETHLISVENPCSDRLTKCSFWAVRGQCYKQKDFMKTNCKRSCLLCPTPTPCRNFNTLCGLWKRMGNCEKRKIMENCPLECNICYIEDLETPGPDTARDVRPVATCADYHFKCDDQATARDCLFSDIVQRLCPKTCGRCDLFISGNTNRRSSQATARQRQSSPASSAHQIQSVRHQPSHRRPGQSHTMPAGWRRCTDHNDSCAKWARKRRCRWAHVWSQCRKSCGFCQDDDDGVDEADFRVGNHEKRKYLKHAVF